LTDLNTLRISEMFLSIQGESTMAGLPCTFIRLQGCGLRCSWCDTAYALDLTAPADVYTLQEIAAAVDRFGCGLVELTGGEPLEQDAVYELMTMLCDKGYRVMIETGGYLDVQRIDNRVKKIVDFKCPSSGMVKKNFMGNIDHLTPDDEVKFVIGTEEDYQWSKELMQAHRLSEKCSVLLSPVFGVMQPLQLSQWLLRDHLVARLQLQMHKFIWDPNQRGV
jgi:7-carboxy-7-deazaguanine synthase